MKTFALFYIVSLLLGSTVGRLLILGGVLWYLDDRYFGLLASLWAPILRSQRIASLRHAVELNPSDVRSMVELGEHYLRAARPKVAAEYLERAFERREDSARALLLLGAAWIKLGRHPEGKAKLEEALAKSPEVGFGEPYIYLLESAFATASPESPVVDQLIERFDQFDSVEVLTRAGQLCATAGRRDLARRLLQKAVEHYRYVPKKMRRRERRWLVRAHLGLLQVR